MFRLARRQDEGANITAISTAGIALEGSALDILRENTRVAESDALKIRERGERTAAAFRRGASDIRAAGRERGRAADISAATTLLGGAARTFDIATRT